MTRKAIVTGHSRGIGAALAALLRAEGWEVLGLSRSAGERVDLADPAALTAWLTGGRLAGFLADAGEVLVINNAGLLGPVGVDGPLDAASTVAAVNVNVTAPILLTDAVIAQRPADATVRVAHISSGAGRRPIVGWGVYCATKGAVDQHAATLAAEGRPGVRIAAVAPGVVDTAMQAQIRVEDGFPLRDDFVAMHAEGQLRSPEEAARLLLDLVTADDYGDEPLTRI